jgi:hypothetical protein
MMFEEPVLFDHPLFESASMAVCICRELLEQNEFPDEAAALRNIEPVTNAVLARIAVDVLRDIRVTGACAEYVQIATNLCNEAIGTSYKRVG